MKPGLEEDTNGYDDTAHPTKAPGAQVFEKDGYEKDRPKGLETV